MHTRNFAPIALAMGSIAALGQGPATAQVQPFPAGFHSERIPTNGTTLYTRIGGTGPAVLLHGYGETGDMWSPLAAKLAANHTVIVPDLRGRGSTGPIWSLTTSATWSGTPLPPNIPPG